jgi:CheY-like chemotaxis protein
MTKRVLDVGQCNPDHAAIRRLLERSFSVNVVRTHELQDTLQALREQAYDLILINRKLDIDYSDGMEILTEIKADPELSQIPVMLVTNFPEYQEAAVAAGAVSGFGKDQLNQAQTVEKLKPYLS